MQLFVSPVFDLCRIGEIEGQTLRYPAGRPIHRLFVIVFPDGADSKGWDVRRIGLELGVV